MWTCSWRSPRRLHVLSSQQSRVHHYKRPTCKNPSTGTAQQRLNLVLKVVLHAVVVILGTLQLSTKSRCSRCCMAHLCSAPSFGHYASDEATIQADKA